jgi:hypothetical protein
MSVFERNHRGILGVDRPKPAERLTTVGWIERCFPGSDSGASASKGSKNATVLEKKVR